MDKQEVLRRVAEPNRLLVEGRRTIDRQRDIIAPLERMGIDSTKQHALLTLLALQLHFSLEVGTARLGLVSASPQ
jgi:hypothetical protein